MGVTYLLDTHVLLWLWGSPGRLGTRLLDELGDPRTRLLVSAISATEVATKTRLGKLPGGDVVTSTWTPRITEIQAEELPVTTAHTLLAGGMTWAHRDPFDRILVAQALTEGVPLVSGDTVMSQVPGLRVVDPR